LPLPFDYVKTQLYKQKKLPDGIMPFKARFLRVEA
jgi:hypothetical protein